MTTASAAVAVSGTLWYPIHPGVLAATVAAAWLPSLSAAPAQRQAASTSILKSATTKLRLVTDRTGR